MFNPQATGTSFVDPRARFQALQQLYQAYPGRRSGGSGLTGLASNDSTGWRDMLNEQQEYQSLQNYMGGKSPTMNAVHHGSDESAFGALPSTYNPAFQHSAVENNGALSGLQGAYQPHQDWMQKNPAAQAYQRGRK